MENRSEKKYGNITVIQRLDYKWGVVNDKGEEIVSFGKYAWIDGFEYGLARVHNYGRILFNPKNLICIIDEDSKLITDKNTIEEIEFEDWKTHLESYAKWGIINDNGEEVIPCEYDSIWNFLGKNKSNTKVVKDNKEWDVNFIDLNPSLTIVSNSYFGKHFSNNFNQNKQHE